MSVEFIIKGDFLFAYLKGDIDHHRAAEMRFLIDGELERRTPRMLVMDFGGVDFMDSSGIGLILGRLRVVKSWGGRLSLENVKPPVYKMLQMAGLDRIFSITKG